MTALAAGKLENVMSVKSCEDPFVCPLSRPVNGFSLL